jgi:4-diphosphocytidyl-2-C-methyl-D-erythritol kinase
LSSIARSRILSLMTPRPQRATVLAPAKVNVSLRVLGRREDGYHLIESLMLPVSLCDSLDIAIRRRKTGSRSVRCHVVGPERVPDGPGNLAVRAAKAVLDELEEKADVEIRLNKRIPVGAGLGGGSSDAAAVLSALPQLLGRRVPKRRVAEIALALGADVPFFLACRPAWASGIGERLEPLPRPGRVDLVIAVPRTRVSTAWAYANALPPLGRLTTRKRGGPGSRGLRITAKSLSCHVSNDFEARVAVAVPDVARLKRRLEALGAMTTIMSGSGSAVIGIYASGTAASDAASKLQSPDQAWAVRSLLRRPRRDE